MRILVVDDELTKAQFISSHLVSRGLTSEIEHASTASAARKALRSGSFDMLVIDLNLPAAIDDKPASTGGLDFLDLVLIDSNISLPQDVVFITGREDLVIEARSETRRRGAELFQFNSKDDDWIASLIGRIEYSIRRLERIPSAQKIDIALMTALATPEFDAVLALPYKWIARKFPGDFVTYHFGEFLSEGNRARRIVAAHAQRKGMPSSASLAARLTQHFSPRYLVMTGICAGITGNAALGDVIVADPTWDYGAGKRAQDAVGSPVFRGAPHQMALRPSVAQLASEVGRRPETLAGIRSGWTEEVPQGSLAVRLGPMASGASVIADDNEARAVVLQHKELLGIEMEAYAVMSAVEYVDAAPCALVIKSVCDFADQYKADDWQRYASYTSAVFADRLFREAEFWRD